MSTFKFKLIDHFVLTVNDIERSIRFYRDILGCPLISFGSGRQAVMIGQSKINFHCADSPIVPHAQTPVPGSADFCLITDSPIEEVINAIQIKGVQIELGPVKRTGATGEIVSIYLRDPDGNLIEIGSHNF